MGGCFDWQEGDRVNDKGEYRSGGDVRGRWRWKGRRDERERKDEESQRTTIPIVGVSKSVATYMTKEFKPRRMMCTRRRML